MKKNKFSLKSLLKLVLTLAISASCLYYAGRKTEFSKVWNDIQNIKTIYLLSGMAMSVLVLSMRALRWHLVLQREQRFAFSNTLWSTAIGYLANSILPARAGEVIRSVILGLSANIRKSLVMATAFSERVLDAGVLLTLAFIMLKFTVTLPAVIRNSWKLLLPLVAVLMCLVAVAPLMQKVWFKFIAWIPFHSLREKTRIVFVGLLDGIRIFYSWKILIVFISMSVVIWLFDAYVMLTLARSFDAELSLPQATIFVAALGFASSVPSTPGYVGVYQAIAVTILPVFGIASERAFLLISTFQILFLLMTGVLGGSGWLIMQRRIGAQRIENELAESEGS